MPCFWYIILKNTCFQTPLFTSGETPKWSFWHRQDVQNGDLDFQIWHQNWCSRTQDLIKIMFSRPPPEGRKERKKKISLFFVLCRVLGTDPSKNVFFKHLFTRSQSWSNLDIWMSRTRNACSVPPLERVEKRGKKRFRFFSFFAGFLGPTRQKRCFSNTSLHFGRTTFWSKWWSKSDHRMIILTSSGCQKWWSKSGSQDLKSEIWISDLRSVQNTFQVLDVIHIKSTIIFFHLGHSFF